jgi:hypothetical protein
MKNKRSKIFLSGMLVFALVFGLIVMGCPTDGGTEEENNVTKFEGTWANKGDNWDLVYTFTGNRVKYSDHTNNTWSGTFAFTDTEITFSVSQNTWTQGYTLEGNTLIIANTGGNNPYGTFLKQE